ncbi:hypothetical protein ACIRO3_36490 [Streptomyces sp. NPDC102278]|uniref:hypothetical protein n=1 Tax=Streptomyces sp. NPDC102278 TaxID=3366152 RepID=UPI0038001504
MQDALLPLPPALDQLLVIRRWLELTLARVDERITAVRAADEQRAHRLPPPEPPRWWIEYGIGAGRRPDRVHTGACKVTSRGRAATRDGWAFQLTLGVQSHPLSGAINGSKTGS